MQFTSVQRFLVLGVSAAGLVACASEPPHEDAPALGSYLGTPAAPANPIAPKLSTCPDGLNSMGTPAQPSCQPSQRPELPRAALSCPAGWDMATQEIDPYGARIQVPMCRPKAPSTRCADRHRIDLSTGICVPVGQACPSGAPWPPTLPSGSATVYVRAGANGFGTADAPYGNFTQALQSTPAGGVLVVGPGIYPTSARIERPVTIVGVCPELVTIEGLESSMLEVAGDPSTIEGAFEVQAPGMLTLSNLTLRGKRVGLHVRSGASAHVSGVRFDQNTNKAIVVDGGRLDLRDAIVERTLPLPDGRKGRGLQVNQAGLATVQNVTFQDNDRTEVAVYHPGTDISLTDVVLQNTRIDGTSDGNGLLAAESARVQATRMFVRGKRSVAVYGVAGAELQLDRSYIAQTQADQAGWGMGLRLEQSSAHVTNSLFFAHTLNGIFAGASRLTGNDVTVVSSFGHPADLSVGRGIAAFDGATVDLQRVLVTHSEETGVFVSNSKATISDLSLERNSLVGIIAEQKADVAISRARSFHDELCGAIARTSGRLRLVDTTIDDVLEDKGRSLDGGWGILNKGATLSLERVAIRRTTEFGLASLQGTTDLKSVVVEDTAADAGDGTEAIGIVVQGGEVAVQGLLVRRSQGGGIAAGVIPKEDDASAAPIDPTRIEGSDVVVEYTSPNPASKKLGMGVVLAAGVEAKLERLAISHSFNAGLVTQYDNDVTIDDLSVQNTKPELSSGYQGLGIASLHGSKLQLQRAKVSQSSMLGVMISGSLSSIRASDLAVMDTTPARELHGGGIAVLAGAGFDVTRAKITGHHATGILAQFAAAVKAKDLVVADIASGTFPNEDIFGKDDIKGAGDCILALSRAKVDLERASLSGCARVGALFDDASGTLSDVQIQGAPLGIALQGFPRPALTWSSVGVQGSATAFAHGASLPVPATSPPILSAGSQLGNLVRTP